MADKRITVSLDMLTDDAKKALDSFLQQVVKSTSTVNNSMGDFGKFGTNVTDSFKRSVNEIIGLQKQLQDAMKSTGRTLFEPQSRESSMNALNEGLKKIVQDKLDGIKREISIARDADKEASRMLAEYVAGVGAGAPMDEITNDEIRKASERKSETSSKLARLEKEAERLKPDVAGAEGGSSGIDRLFDKIAQKSGLPPELVATLGSLAVGVTAIATADKVRSMALNLGTYNVGATTQYLTGGDIGGTGSQLFARAALQRTPTGEYGNALQGGRSLFSRARIGLNFLFAGGAYPEQAGEAMDTAVKQENERLLQDQMAAYAPYEQMAYQNMISAGQALYPGERMFGMDASQRWRSSMQLRGIPLERLAQASRLSGAYLGGLTQDQGLINFANRYNLGQTGAQELFRSRSMNPNAGLNLQGMMGFAGLGTGAADMATGAISEAAAQYGAQFSAADSQNAQMPFFNATQMITGSIPGLSTNQADLSKYTIAATQSQLGLAGSTGTLEDITMRSTMASMGITNPATMRMVQKMIASGNIDMAMKLVSGTVQKMGGKMTPAEAQRDFSVRMARTRGMENQILAGAGGGKEAQEVLQQMAKEQGVKGSFDLLGFEQGGGTDITKGAAFTAASLPSLLSGKTTLSKEEMAKFAVGAGGREPTTDDTQKELAAMRNALNDINTSLKGAVEGSAPFKMYLEDMSQRAAQSISHAGQERQDEAMPGKRELMDALKNGAIIGDRLSTKTGTNTGPLPVPKH